MTLNTGGMSGKLLDSNGTDNIFKFLTHSLGLSDMISNDLPSLFSVNVELFWNSCCFISITRNVKYAQEVYEVYPNGKDETYSVLS